MTAEAEKRADNRNGNQEKNMGVLRKIKIRDVILITIGSGLIAFAIQCFFDPVGLVTGGFTGLAIVIKDVTKAMIPGGIPLWLTNIALNVPVFLLAWICMDRRFMGNTIFGTVMLSVWLYIIPSVHMAENDILLAAVFGGVFCGVGFGLVLRARATTGGTDMVAAIIQSRLKQYSVMQVIQVVDDLIILLGFFVFGLRATLYAVVAIFVQTKVSDAFLEGFKYAKAAFIITDKHDEVAHRILTDLDRGVTGLEARGMYTNKEKCVLYCIVSKKEIVQVKEMVHEVDPEAFVIVSDVREVLGEGFSA